MLLRPVPGGVSSYYGYRIHPIYGDRRLHTGWDMNAGCGAPILASESGTVIFSGWKGGYGNAIIIDHGGGMSTLYGHQSRLGLSYGQSTTVGDVIGWIGTTGMSTVLPPPLRSKDQRQPGRPGALSVMSEKKIATNRRARFDYEIFDTYEAGLVLLGSEVKSLREGRAHLSDAYAIVKDDEMWLIGCHISPYPFARGGGHEPDRTRKLLLHRNEIERIRTQIAEKGRTVVPDADVLQGRQGQARTRRGQGQGPLRQAGDPEAQAGRPRDGTGDALQEPRLATHRSFGESCQVLLRNLFGHTDVLQ